MNISFVKSYAIIAIIVGTFFVNPTTSYSNPSYPNFTEVVEKNIPAVVIVHAKKKILGNNNINQNMPNLPDELKPFLDKFLMERMAILANQEKRQVSALVLF